MDSTVVAIIGCVGSLLGVMASSKRHRPAGGAGWHGRGKTKKRWAAKEAAA